MSNWIVPTDLDHHTDTINPPGDPWGDEGLEGTVRRVRATLPPPVPAPSAVGRVRPAWRRARFWVDLTLIAVTGLVGVFVAAMIVSALFVRIR